MIILGLTGSIAMGKSTTAAMFRARGVPVHDADAAVSEAYAPGGEALGPVGALVPGAVTDGVLDREVLRRAIAEDASILPRIEAVVHPIVGAAKARFLAQARAAGAEVVVLDIPLLFETGGNAACDHVVVVSAPEAVQRERALARDGMTPARLDAILARQVPDSEKRARADFVIDTGAGLDAAEAQVDTILRALHGEADMCEDNA